MLNSWQRRLVLLEDAFLTVTRHASRKEAKRQAHLDAQQFALLEQDIALATYSVCFPELLSRIPDCFFDSTEKRNVSPLDLVRWNVEELVAQHLFKRWDNTHREDGNE